MTQSQSSRERPSLHPETRMQQEMDSDAMFYIISRDCHFWRVENRTPWPRAWHFQRHQLSSHSELSASHVLLDSPRSARGCRVGAERTGQGDTWETRGTTGMMREDSGLGPGASYVTQSNAWTSKRWTVLVNKSLLVLIGCWALQNQVTSKTVHTQGQDVHTPKNYL